MYIAADLIMPNVGVMFWTILIFLIAFYILKTKAWGPITSSIQEREQNISDSLSRAENALAEAKKLSADNDAKRKEAELEAQQLVRDARAAAETIKAKEVEDTKAQLKRMQEQAALEIEREKQSAIQGLRSEMANLVVDATEKVVKERLDDKKDLALINDFLQKLN